MPPLVALRLGGGRIANGPCSRANGALTAYAVEVLSIARLA